MQRLNANTLYVYLVLEGHFHRFHGPRIPCPVCPKGKVSLTKTRLYRHLQVDHDMYICSKPTCKKRMTYAERLDHVCQNRVYPKKAKPKVKAYNMKSKEIIESSEEEEVIESTEEEEEHGYADSSDIESLHLALSEQSSDDDSIVPILNEPENTEINLPQANCEEQEPNLPKTLLESSIDLYCPPTTIIDSVITNDDLGQGPSNDILTTDLHSMLPSHATDTNLSNHLNDRLLDVSLGQADPHQVIEPEMPNLQGLPGVSDILEQTRRELDSLNE